MTPAHYRIRRVRLIDHLDEPTTKAWRNLLLRSEDARLEHDLDWLRVEHNDRLEDTYALLASVEDTLVGLLTFGVHARRCALLAPPLGPEDHVLWDRLFEELSLGRGLTYDAVQLEVEEGEPLQAYLQISALVQERFLALPAAPQERHRLDPSTLRKAPRRSDPRIRRVVQPDEARAFVELLGKRAHEIARDEDHALLQCRFAAARGWLCAWLLYERERPVAYLHGNVYNGRLSRLNYGSLHDEEGATALVHAAVDEYQDLKCIELAGPAVAPFVAVKSESWVLVGPGRIPRVSARLQDISARARRSGRALRRWFPGR